MKNSVIEKKIKKKVEDQKDRLLERIRGLRILVEKTVKNGIGFRCNGTRIIKFVEHKKSKIILPTLKVNASWAKRLEAEYYKAKNVYYVDIAKNEDIIYFVKEEIIRIEKTKKPTINKREERKKTTREDKLAKAKAAIKHHEEEE